MTLRVDNLSAWYGQARALWNIDMDLAEGEVVGVLGRNGAGKTTLLRSIAGLHQKTEGEVRVNGEVVSRKQANVIALQGLAFVREGARLPASLTVLQNLQLGQRLARKRGRAARPLSEIWRWFPILKPLQDRKAGLLSGGQRQALALAVAFVAQPTTMLLDEPSAGLSPPVASELFATIKQLANSGVSVLVVEQHPAWLIGLAERGYLLEVGKLVAQGPLHQLLGSAVSRDISYSVVGNLDDENASEIRIE